MAKISPKFMCIDILLSCFLSCVPGPGAELTNFNDKGEGGGGSNFIPKKITTSEFVYPKKSLLFFSIPQKNPLVLFLEPKKIPVFFRNPKNPSVFHRPKKITFGQNFRTQKITRTPPPPSLPSLKYMSAALGLSSYLMFISWL